LVPVEARARNSRVAAMRVAIGAIPASPNRASAMGFFSRVVTKAMAALQPSTTARIEKNVSLISPLSVLQGRNRLRA